MLSKDDIDISNKHAKKKKNREFSLIAINNRAFAIIAILVITVMFQGYYAHNASLRAEANTELLYVKMYSDGTWEIEKSLPDKPSEYLESTINKLLKDFTLLRYSKNPTTISSDYGKAMTFMSPEAANHFIKESGFNAIKVAANAKNNQTFVRLKFSNKSIKHYEKEDINFGKYTDNVYRSHIRFSRMTRKRDGSYSKPKYEILDIRWRLLPKDEWKARLNGKETKDRDETISANPIGLQIIDYKLYDDTQSQENAKENF